MSHQVPSLPPHVAQPKGWPTLPRGRAGLMGVLNITPNSFSDGGQYFNLDEALVRAREIEAEGADILDIGGESTNPKALPISAEEEIARVLPVLKALRGQLGIPVSIDTYKAATARVALAHGATLINDVWGLQKDPDMARVVADHGVGVCLMHNRETTDPAVDILADIERFFDRTLEIADKAGIDRATIMLDPGIGFGKTPEQNLTILNRFETLHRFGQPLLIGCSRKRFIGTITGHEVAADRMAGSLATHIIAVTKGAAFVRAHDIAPHRDALLIAAAIQRQAL